MNYLKLVGFFFLLSLLFESCTNKLSQTPPVDTTNSSTELTGKDLFIEWGKKNKVPFDINNKASLDSLVKTMAQDIGTAKVVLFSEGFHNCEEMFQLQYALITHLVTNKGFNLVATESGLPESKHINDYIHGQDSIPKMWESSLSRLYRPWKIGRATINWLAAYNQANGNTIDYIGADIGGFYQDWEFPFQQIFTYLDQVDTATSTPLKENMAVYFKAMKPYAAYYYVRRLSRQQKDELAALLDELIQTFTQNEAAYISKSDKKTYTWVLQCVKAMRFAEHYYRNYQNVTDTTKNLVPVYLGGSGRELAMAENIKWMYNRKKDAKIIVINHVIHNKTATQDQGEFYRNFTPMGQLLKQEFKEDLFVIGMAYGKGHYWKTWQVPSMRKVDTIPPSDTAGMERVLHAVAPQDFYLHLANPPLLTYKWLYQDIPLRENDYTILLKPAEWDACFYLEEVGPAVLVE